MNKQPPQKLNTFALVRELPKKASLAFAATLLQRMHVNYALFCELNEFGDADVAQNIINLLWEYVKTPKMKINVEVQSDKIEDITPDVVDFDNFGVYPALDFCMGLQAALQIVNDEIPDGAVTIAKLSQGGTEAYINELSDEDISGLELKQHELMQFEIQVQQYVLSLCQEKPIAISELDEFLKTDLVSNIGLGLD